MTSPPVDPRIERARLLYVDSDVPMRDISLRVGVPLGTLAKWVARFDWPRRSLDPSYCGPHNPKPARRAQTQAANAPAPPPVLEDAPPSPKAPPAKRAPGPGKRRPQISSLIDRLYRIITHNLETMESRMTGDDHSPADNPERDARAIGNLVRSVEKLKELEPDQSKRATRSTGRYPLTATEEDKLRDEIVERLIKLRERSRNSPAG